MARYFFSIRVRERLLPDREGVDLPAGSDPKQCALYLAHKLRAEKVISADLDGCFVEVVDSLGVHVALVPVLEDAAHG